MSQAAQAHDDPWADPQNRRTRREPVSWASAEDLEILGGLGEGREADWTVLTLEREDASDEAAAAPTGRPARSWAERAERAATSADATGPAADGDRVVELDRAPRSALLRGRAARRTIDESARATFADHADGAVTETHAVPRAGDAHAPAEQAPAHERPAGAPRASRPRRVSGPASNARAAARAQARATLDLGSLADEAFADPRPAASRRAASDLAPADDAAEGLSLLRAVEQDLDALATAPAHPERAVEPRAAAPGGRRTVVIRGQVADRGSALAGPERRRPAPRARDRVGHRPDRVALWAVMLGLLLIIVAMMTAG
ncbi:MAG TPA: hypothetical protein VIL49_07565 [Capillimicrobium sp.]|jgi:hypothetical protein